MKIFLPLILLFCFGQFAKSQVTTPIIKANFGIEADLTSNYYNNAPQPAVDDWFSNGNPGTGDFVIDTTGAASIVSGYTINPASRTKSFYRLMRQAPYSTINNRLLLDAIFIRDFHADDSTIFASGSNKNGMSPAAWSCPVSQNIPDKNDILDAFTHVRRAGPNVTDSLWMFGGISIENTTGSRYFDFELYQTDIAYNRTTLTFSGYGPDAGHTSWVFDAAGNIVSPGDIILTAEFGSGGLTTVEARIWVRRSSLLIAPTTFNWGGAFDGNGSGATFGYANITPKTAGAFYTGIQSSAAATWAGPFALVTENNSLVPSYVPKQFMEFSVNLTKLGIEPASFSSNACGSPFRRVLIKTRASTSFTAELKDFIAPYRMFDFPKVDAYTFYTYFCGTMPSTTINVINPISTSTYTWSTNNGHIVGSNSGITLTVNAPGTYYVTQQLNSQCPRYAVDSVKIIFDTICYILKADIIKLDVRQVETERELKWDVNNNESAFSYTVEYSYDNKTYHELAVIPTDEKKGQATYIFRDVLAYNNYKFIFYRIKVTGKNHEIKYSKTVLFRPGNEKIKNPFLFPNPSQGEVWMAYETPEKTNMTINLYDMAGRSVKTFHLNLSQGNNLLQLNFSEQKCGMYIIKIESGLGVSLHKMMISK